MTSSITYGIETLTIDGLTFFYSYLTFKMYVKIRVTVSTRVAGNSDSLFKMVGHYRFVHFFFYFLCVLKSK